MNKPMSILVVDDDKMNIDLLEQALEETGQSIVTAGNGEEALAALSRLSDVQGFPGIVVTDMKMPVMDGLEFLKRARAMDSDLPVILITAYGDVASAVKAMKNGAWDFIERPFDGEQLRTRVIRALESRSLVLENRRLKAELASRPGMAAKLIGSAPAVRTLREQIANIAGTDANVLIHGETGTGKEVAARCLHEFSGRKRARFVAINCGAIPETMFESELFGHEAGAFTGANRRRVGQIEFASGGTLFLDEIESMPLNLQVKLLRTLQERVVSRLGSNEEIRVNVRVVAATKTDLQEAAMKGDFREDLYYRLNVAELHIPPLRERREDIPLLFEHFIQELAARHGRDVPEQSHKDMQALFAHDWPGNVRELRNVAERCVLGLGDVSRMLSRQAGTTQTLPEQVGSFESAVIAQVLAEKSGAIQETADVLGIPRRTLNEKMRKYGLDRKDFQ
jgi:two-component system C4-dicarboxylate transport response regulator DctD